MTQPSTTIRVSAAQRSRLRLLASDRNASMAETLDAALEALRRADFYTKMATAEQQLREDPAQWDSYVSERDEWLNPELGGQ